MDFSKEGLEEASKGDGPNLRHHRSADAGVPRSGPSERRSDSALMESFRQEMDDDFNTPRALALIFDEVRALNRLLDEKKTQGIENRARRASCDV